MSFAHKESRSLSPGRTLRSFRTIFQDRVGSLLESVKGLEAELAIRNADVERANTVLRQRENEVKAWDHKYGQVLPMWRIFLSNCTGCCGMEKQIFKSTATAVNRFFPQTSLWRISFCGSQNIGIGDGFRGISMVFMGFLRICVLPKRPTEIGSSTLL